MWIVHGVGVRLKASVRKVDLGLERLLLEVLVAAGVTEGVREAKTEKRKTCEGKPKN